VKEKELKTKNAPERPRSKNGGNFFIAKKIVQKEKSLTD